MCQAVDLNLLNPGLNLEFRVTVTVSRNPDQCFPTLLTKTFFSPSCVAWLKAIARSLSIALATEPMNFCQVLHPIWFFRECLLAYSAYHVICLGGLRLFP